MPQLDSLRALAVLPVFAAHWIGGKASHGGPLGVRLFFVLSGFLITSILLRVRLRIEQGDGKWTTHLLHFYARRALRLYPALVLFVGLLAISGYGPARETWPWHVTYLSNIRFALINGWEHGLGHLWSLSIEEQFYLFWPLVILLVRRSLHVPLAFGLMFVAWALRIVILAEGIRAMAAYTLPFVWLDALGVGALLAFATDPNSTGAPVSRENLSRFGLWFGLPLFVVSVTLRVGTYFSLTSWLFLEFSASMFFLWLVSRAAAGFKGPLGKLLDFKPLIFLGEISYGLYLFHPIIPHAFNWVLAYFGLPLTSWGVPDVLYRLAVEVAPHYGSRISAIMMPVIYTIFTVLIATISWYFWERPFIGFRRLIAYPNHAASASTSVDSPGSPTQAT
jgi:peptidoglycan/LPS O-acetylase OafA/YrhL